MPAVTLPLVDGSTVLGPSIATAQGVTLPLIDGGVTFGPAGAVASDSITAGMVVRNGATVLDGFRRQFTDELVGAGGFSLTLYNDDADMPDFDDVLTFDLDGVSRFAGLVEGKRVITVDPREEVEHVTQITGRNHIAEADQALIEPVRGLDAVPVELSRLWAWPSFDFDDTAWPDAKRIRRADQPVPYHPYRSMPEWWPDKGAWWVWADRADVSASEAPPGTCLLRSTVTLTEGTIEILFGVNNLARAVYFDGARIGNIDNYPPEGTRIRLDVSTGDHVIAARVTNYIRDGGFCWSIWTVDDDGLLDTLVESSDTTNTKCLPYPGTTPVGFTPGEIIRLAVEEAQARGELAGWTLDFTDTLDTAGEPWEIVAEVTADIGRSVWDLLDSMSDWLIDVYRAPGGPLQAWSRGGRGTTRAVTLAVTTNPDTSELARLVHDGKHVRANRLVLTYRGGHVEVEDSTSIAANGQRTAYVSLGDGVHAETTALAAGADLLDLRKDPSYAVSFDLTAAASIPYQTFDNGDTITHPDETGTPDTSRVRSITVTEDDEGVVDYGGTIRDVRRETTERLELWLRRMAHGGLDGGARVATRLGESLGPTVRVSAKNVAEFSFDNVALVASYSPKRPADSSGNLIEIYAELTTAGSTTTTVRVYRNGVQIGADLDFASGVTKAEVDLEAAKCYRNVDLFQARIVTAGTGAEGLDVQVRAI